jgi:hypothetical protein
VTTDEAIKFLKETSRYFTNIASNSQEDREYWAAVYNSDNCIKIANLIKELSKDD